MEAGMARDTALKQTWPEQSTASAADARKWW